MTGMTSLQTKPQLPPVLRRVALWMMMMLGASYLSTLVMTHFLHLDHLWGTLWIWRGNQWCDFYYFQDRSLHFMTTSYWDDKWGYPITYPAPVAVVLGLFYKLSHPFQTYFAVLILAILTWGTWLARGLMSRGIRRDQAIAFALVLMGSTWPVAYLLDTANIEGLMAILLATGVLAVLRDKTWLGATLIAMAASLKLFPLILLALLLSKRRYKEFAYGCVLTPVLILASLALLGPNISSAQFHIMEGMRFLKVNFIIERRAINFNFSHALFNPIKFAVLWIDRQLHSGGSIGPVRHELAVADAALRIYTVLTAIVGTTLYFWRIRKLPMLNQVICLTVAAVTLTPFSSDYTLIHTLIPFTLLCFYAVEAWQQQRTVRGLDLCFACFCFILAWMTFFTWGYVYNDFVRTLALLVLLGTAIRVPFPWPTLDQPGSPDPVSGAVRA